MRGKNGRSVIIEQLLADGIEYMFGNPGTVEQGFLDALADYPQMKYILTLQESIAVTMADGYARAARKPAIVQLHSAPGLGNGIGNLYQALRGHSPLVVLAGDAGVQYDAMDAQMAADMVGIARPVTKWAARVTEHCSVLRLLRRAIKIAATPPMGPTFLCLPADVLDAPNDEDVVPTPIPVTRVAPEAEEIARMAQLLAGAARPLFIIGDGVAASGAQEELAHVAETAGAEVWGAESSEVNMRASHPQFQGLLGHMFGEHSRHLTDKADVVLICGTYVFPEVYPVLRGVFATGSQIIHIDLNAYEIGKNFPVALGVVSDPKLTLARLGPALEKAMSAAQKRAARERVSAMVARKEKEREGARQADIAVRDAVPLHASRFMEELAGALPKDAIVFDEALTSSPELTRYLPPDTPGQYFQTRGGSLGVGFPGAIGLKLANPDKTVVGFSGDGGSMYTIQALWTAAHHKVGTKFVVCNNQSYRLLKFNIHQYWDEQDLPDRNFPAPFDIADPGINFAELARAMGVRGARVEKPEQIGQAIRDALAHDGPFLIEVLLNKDVPDHFVYLKCGQ